MSRARTPFGAVPISTIYGFDYPLSNGIDKVETSTKHQADEIHRATVKPEMPQRTTTMSFTSTTPWDKTGFYYSPRYPQSHKGTASTYSSSFSRRYPVRRFVP